MDSFAIGKQLSSEASKSIHICSQCTRTFKDINNFREHLFQEHGELGVNIRQCHLCSYATLLKSKYDCHIRCHLNNQVIRCQKCTYSTINIRHMSKHERQHSLSHVINTSSSTKKRARVEDPNINYTNKDEKINLPTDKLLIPDHKTSLHTSISSCSTDESHRIPCSHQNSLTALRSNVWSLLRILVPQLSLYYPSTLMIDYETDPSIDRLVANLIQIPSFNRPYPSL